MKCKVIFAVMFLILLTIGVYAEETRVAPKDTLKAVSVADTVPEPVETEEEQIKPLPKGRKADMKEKAEEKEKKEKAEAKNPAIPYEWGTLINAESVKDTGYIIMYFMDEELNIRVAIWEMGKKKVRLYKLLFFERGVEPLVPFKK
ncbi:hypothetical protein KAU32_06555 [bacterium]|nr:hypothetical protein [bacterium]